MFLHEQSTPTPLKIFLHKFDIPYKPLPGSVSDKLILQNHHMQHRHISAVRLGPVSGPIPNRQMVLNQTMNLCHIAHSRKLK